MPDKWYGIAVVVLDVGANRCFQFFGGAMDAAAKLLFRSSANQHWTRLSQQAEVEMEARPLEQPVSDQLGLWVP